MRSMDSQGVLNMKNMSLTKSLKAALIILCLALLAAAQSSGDLNRMRAEQPSGQPISSILNTDGSIRPGVSGSFDPKGFRMLAGENGSPRFVAHGIGQIDHSSATACEDRWDDRFWPNGVNGPVWALASDGAGNIYIGGSFSIAGDSFAGNIAKWDGSRWSTLGPGVSGGLNWTGVSDIAVSGTDVYVGGSFMNAGGVQVENIAKWDGSSWSALGAGVLGVNAMAVSGTDIYVGGSFQTTGGIVGGIAKWDGTNWIVLGSSGDGGVIAIAISGTHVFVGGSFTSMGGVPANHIAKWSGSTWSALGSGTNDNVHDITVSGTNLFVGGYFTSAGGLGANRIAKWDGSTWSTLGSGLGSAVGGSAHSIAVLGTDVYVGGYFTSAGGLL